MNLATEPWIPAIHGTGELRLLSLLQVFMEGDEVLDLAVRPHERIALLRLLICLSQAALDGPSDIDEWNAAPEMLPRSASGYLEKWRDAFDLFHPERPFLQFPGLRKEGEPTPVSKLDFALATGNASTLFDHEANQGCLRSFSPGCMAVLLVTYLNFSPGGLIAQVEWNGMQTSKSSEDAPCVSASMLHSFVRGNSLLATVCLNLLTRNAVTDFYGEDHWGRPVWETMPKFFNDQEAIANCTQTYLGRLVPLPRLVLLNPAGETMLLGNGLKYPVFPAVRGEPSATEVKLKEKSALLSAGRKDIWRELPALIVKRHANNVGGALTLQNVPENHSFDLYVGALQRKSGQAEVIDTVESVLHVPAGLQTDAGRAAYEAEVKAAEDLARRLRWAVEAYREHIDGGWEGRLRSAGLNKAGLREKLTASAMQFYWTAVEKLRPLLLAHVQALYGSVQAIETSRSAWRKEISRAAREAYGVACGRETPRQIRAFSIGMERLFSPILKADQPVEESEEETSDI